MCGNDSKTDAEQDSKVPKTRNPVQPSNDASVLKTIRSLRATNAGQAEGEAFAAE